MFDSVLHPATETAIGAKPLDNGLSDEEIEEVIEEMQGKKDEEDIDIPEKPKDENVFDIF